MADCMDLDLLSKLEILRLKGKHIRIETDKECYRITNYSDESRPLWLDETGGVDWYSENIFVEGRTLKDVLQNLFRDETIKKIFEEI